MMKYRIHVVLKPDLESLKEGLAFWGSNYEIEKLKPIPHEPDTYLVRCDLTKEAALELRKKLSPFMQTSELKSVGPLRLENDPRYALRCTLKVDRCSVLDAIAPIETLSELRLADRKFGKEKWDRVPKLLIGDLSESEAKEIQTKIQTLVLECEILRTSFWVHKSRRTLFVNLFVLFVILAGFFAAFLPGGEKLWIVALANLIVLGATYTAIGFEWERGPSILVRRKR